MPTPELMTWDAKQSRWTKKYRKQRFTVAASVLGGSGKWDTLKAANAWWTAKRAELDANPVQDALDAIPGDATLNEAIERGKLANLVQVVRESILAGGIGEESPVAVADAVRGIAAGLEGRWAGDLKSHFALWKEVQLATTNSAARKKMNIHMAQFFVDFCGGSAIDETLWQKYWHHLAGQKWKSGYKRRVLATARMFVEYLAENRAIVAPANLNSKTLAFKNHVTRPQPASLDVIKSLLGLARGQCRLHCLLMLNTGMLPADISKLRHDMVDWKLGTITRVRTKLADVENAPVVTYKLWPETFALLKEFRSNHPDFVLVTKSGKPWVNNSIEGDKYKNSNSIASVFRNQKGKLDISPKDLRTSGASLLAKHPQYKFYVNHYLADSPRGVAAKYYVVPDQQEFDLALDWLRQQVM